MTASESAWMFVATMSWFAAFTVCPDPAGPTCTIVLPTVSKMGLASSKSAASPPTMMDNAALIAPGSPPETGASSIRKPLSRASAASSTATSGRIEEKSMMSAPALAWANTPSSSSRRTPATSGESGTMIAMTSASATASATLSEDLPPAARRSSYFGLRLRPVTWYPAFCRCTAMGEPMMPSPMKAMFVIYSSPSLLVAPTLARRQPSKWVSGGLVGGGLVLQPDPSAVATTGEVGDPPGDGHLPCPGLVPPRRIGDLDVGDPLGVGFPRRVNVVTVDGEVEDVEEEPDILLTRAVERGNCVGRGFEGIGGRAAHGLHEHGAPDPGHRLGCERKVLCPEFILLRGRGSLDSVAVQRVEGRAPRGFPDPGDDVEVVADLLAAGGPGDQASIPTGHVPGVEVQAGEFDPRILDRAHERVHLILRGR